MSVENEQIIPVQVKYVELQSATILRNEKIPVPNKEQESKQNGPMLQNGLCQSPVAEENLHVTHGSSVTSPCTPINPIIHNRFQFDPNLTYAEKVAHEMIVTEKIYLDNLKQIIDGFLGPVVNDADLNISKDNVDDLFINVEEIYQFNWVLLQDMEKCNYDPVKLAKCFVIKGKQIRRLRRSIEDSLLLDENSFEELELVGKRNYPQIGFDIYTKYCTHYPRSMEVLFEWNQREDTARFIKKQQESLGHTLPLCSFLLKPVQRILKYHLLLGNIAKHFKQSEDEEGYEIIQKALSAMTNVAKHINDMKRKHENAVHLQEIQSVLLDYEGPNLTSFGSIVLEDAFRLHGTKTGRYLLLFEKALLITKRRSDGTFSWKATVMYSNMMLADSVFREPLTFQVIPFDDRKVCYTFVANDLDTKHIWLLELKRRLLDSYAAAVPMKAKEIILGNRREENEKENAEPDSSRKLTDRKGVNQQRQLTKENSGSKLTKNLDTDRRKAKDAHDTAEEKNKTSIDSIKRPLRRKLRVFKKRKFMRDSARSSSRVSWSSDENNDNSYTEKQQHLNINQHKENQHSNNNASEVSISSLLRDGETMVSVAGEVDTHVSDQVKMREGVEDILPSNKRRVTEEKRQKCKSLPTEIFSTRNEDESILTRTHSSSRLHERFLESELIDTPTFIKELQKYGVVNVRENNTRTKRLASYDETLKVINCCSDIGDVTRSQEDDITSEGEPSVLQTVKRVSMAFSDISPSFSAEKSPASSIDDFTTEDITEDLTAGDLTTEDITAGDLTPDEYTHPDVEEDSIVESNAVEDVFYLNVDDYNEGMVHRASVQGNQNATADEDYLKQPRIFEGVNDSDRLSAVHSEQSSYIDTFSDESCDEQSDQSWVSSNLSGSYQRVFTLKRSYSEENLVSKYSIDKTQSEGHPLDVTSKSYTHFGHAPIMRSKSADSSKRWQNFTRPITFSVTPKKKIVIQDSLWETIREHTDANHHEISVEKDFHLRRRRKKRRSGHKKSKQVRPHSSDGRVEGRKQSATVINMADYRQPRNREHGHTNLPVQQFESSRTKIGNSDRKDSTTKIENNRASEVPNSEEKFTNIHETLGLTSPNKTENNCTSKLSNSKEKLANNHETFGSTLCEEIADHPFALANSDEKMGGNNHKTTDLNLHGSVTAEPRAIEKPKTNLDTHVTKIIVEMRKRSPRKVEQEKGLLRVDANVSEVAPTINYLCIEKFPSDESANSDDVFEIISRRTIENAVSKVGRLSKYFSNVANNDGNKCYMKRQTGSARKGCSIKQRVEELSKRDEIQTRKIRKNSEDISISEGKLHKIEDRIGVLRRSSSEDNQTVTKATIDLTSSLNHDKPTVKEIKSRLAELDSGQNELSKTPNKSKRTLNDSANSKKSFTTSLRIKSRIQVLEQNPDKRLHDNIDDNLRTFMRLKERIERLHKGAMKPGVDTELDIKVCEDSDASQTPRQNQELRTVIIKRGWVQQFIQKIETKA